MASAARLGGGAKTLGRGARWALSLGTMEYLNKLRTMTLPASLFSCVPAGSGAAAAAQCGEHGTKEKCETKETPSATASCRWAEAGRYACVKTEVDAKTAKTRRALGIREEECGKKKKEQCKTADSCAWRWEGSRAAYVKGHKAETGGRAAAAAASATGWYALSTAGGLEPAPAGDLAALGPLGGTFAEAKRGFLAGAPPEGARHADLIHDSGGEK